MRRRTAQCPQFNCFGGGGALEAMLSLDLVGNTMASEEDVSQLLEKLKGSPGGVLSNGSASICVGPLHRLYRGTSLIRNSPPP